MNEHRSNLLKLYAASILSGFAVFYNGVDTLFFRHFDLSFEQIGWLVSANLAAILAFEIPTGAFADLYGKKLSVLIGSACSLAGLGFLAFGSSFAAFVAGFVLLGIGRSFRSGAESALLYDWLSSAEKQHEYIKHQSRLQAAFVGIDIISGSVGIWLFSLNVRIPFVISFAAMALVILVQATFRDSARVSAGPGGALASYTHQIRQGLAVIVRSRIITWLIGFTAIYTIANMYFGGTVNLPFLRETKGFSIGQLALMGFVWNAIQTASLFGVSAIERRIGERRSILAIVLLTPALFLGVLLSNHALLSAAIIGLYFSSMSFRDIVVDTYINTRIESRYRATVLSIASMIVSGVAILALPALGMIVDRAGLAAGMALLVVFTLVLGGVSLALKRRWVGAE
jgi:MFS family permease